MRKYSMCLLAAVMLHQLVAAQTIHFLPFASEGNAIELAVVNASAIEATDVKVSVQNAPAWLQFAQKEQTISSVAAGEEQLVTFVFSVDKSAPIGTGQTMTFVITASTGQNWTKQITVTVAAPERFELFQNYPNPFNPTTVISYQLPVDSKVSLRVYNLLGQEVAHLVDGDRKAGHHQETFEARTLASGLYVYQLVGKGATGREFNYRRMMLFLK